MIKRRFLNFNNKILTRNKAGGVFTQSQKRPLQYKTGYDGLTPRNKIAKDAVNNVLQSFNNLNKKGNKTANLDM